MRLLAAVLALLVMGTQLVGQPTSFDDYLRTLDAALALADSHTLDSAMLAEIVPREIKVRFGNAPAFAELSDATISEASDQISWLFDQTEFAYEWSEARVRVWLKTAPGPTEIDLERHPGIDASMALYDFEADGVPELVLDWYSFGTAYFVARWDGAKWSPVSVPLPITVTNETIPGMTLTGLTESGFGDINADGLPEWRVSENGYVNSGSLHILAWRRGGLIPLVEPIRYPSYNIGVDTQFTEDLIRQRVSFGDTWGCEWVDEARYRWNSDMDLYIWVGVSRGYAQSFGCAVRFAEQAHWAGAIDAAAELYRLAMLRAAEDSDPIDTELYQYAHLRAAIAFTLSGQHDAATEALSAVERGNTQSEFVARLFTAVDSNVPDAYRVCAAVFNVFTREWPASPDGYYDAVPTELIVGNVVDYPNPLPIHRLLPTPARAGCDVDQLINSRLGYTVISPRVDPAIRIAEYGLVVDDARQADIDGDGSDEWIVWLSADVPALILKPTANGSYSIDRLPIARVSAEQPIIVPTSTPQLQIDHNMFASLAQCELGSSCDMSDPKSVLAILQDLSYPWYPARHALSRERLDRATAAAIEVKSAAEYPLRYTLGLILTEEGNPDEAILQFETIVERVPDSVWGVLAALHIAGGSSDD
ncbi:MAG: hypothetical protein IPM16_19275 [Chloroflexi bacterium]|nr:hypothetical protein [Chloroflexota bacterium]